MIHDACQTVNNDKHLHRRQQDQHNFSHLWERRFLREFKWRDWWRKWRKSRRRRLNPSHSRSGSPLSRGTLRAREMTWRLALSQKLKRSLTLNWLCNFAKAQPKKCLTDNCFRESKKLWGAAWTPRLRRRSPHPWLTLSSHSNTLWGKRWQASSLQLWADRWCRNSTPSTSSEPAYDVALCVNLFWPTTGRLYRRPSPYRLRAGYKAPIQNKQTRATCPNGFRKNIFL